MWQSLKWMKHLMAIKWSLMSSLVNSQMSLSHKWRLLKTPQNPKDWMKTWLKLSSIYDMLLSGDASVDDVCSTGCLERIERKLEKRGWDDKRTNHKTLVPVYGYDRHIMQVCHSRENGRLEASSEDTSGYAPPLCCFRPQPLHQVSVHLPPGDAMSSW